MKSLPRLLKQSAWILLGLLILVALIAPKHGLARGTASSPDAPSLAAGGPSGAKPPPMPPVGMGDAVDGIENPPAPTESTPDQAVAFVPDLDLDKASLSAEVGKSLPPVVEYTIMEGDTLSQIAETYNTDVPSIMAANTSIQRDRIQIGDKLTIPTTQGLLYTVTRGDTLWDIAQTYGIPESDIIAFNKIDANNPIQIGQRLVLPGAVSAPVAVAVASRSGVDRSSPPPSYSGSGSAGSGYIWPVSGSITSGYGPRWGGWHSGIDIGVPTGTPIAASRGGTVIQAGWRGDYGYAVEISHGNGVTTLYGHQSKILVGVGQQVGQGQTIGLSGSTGNSTGPHVHFEIRVNGSRVNPSPYLP